MYKFTTTLLGGAAMMLAFAACSNDEPVTPPEEKEIDITAEDAGSYSGVFVLNEGNMGANKCTLDFLDYTAGKYLRNIYAERNPSVALELGDTGTDLQINGQRLYAVVNGSHKIEVMDIETATRIGQVDISSPRYITFHGDNAYVSSYVGGDNGCGSVVRFDLATLKVTGSVSVGLSPEEMAIVDGKLYVANSANFNTGEYDNTVSVIDLASFKAEEPVVVEVNLHHLKADSKGNLWVNSRGNYYDIPAALYKLSRGSNGRYAVSASLDIPCTNFAISGDKLLYYATVYDAEWNAVQSYGTVNTLTATDDDHSFITDGTEADITTPYAIEIHPDNGDIYITDAKNYTSSGALYCYSAAGKLKFSATTGDIPGHIVFRK